MNKTVVIKTENLTKAFQRKEVVKQCSISVESGTVYGLLGPNGAGKSTMLKLISGLLVPTMGKVLVFGRDITKEREQILSEVGTLIEAPIFYEHLSARENLEIHCAYMGKGSGNINPALARVGLDAGAKPVSTFSLGMRQRLAIARAIVHEPKLLVLDEPINGLDPMGIREMRELFMDLVKKQNMTLLISSHILTEMEQIADYIGLIQFGTIVKETSMTELRTAYPSGLERYFMEMMAGGKKYECTN